MRKGKIFALTVLAMSIAFTAGIAQAKDSYLAAFNKKYGTQKTKLNTCTVCHTTGSNLNVYGIAFATRHTGTVPKALKVIQPLDSDKDGFTNIAEIKARTFPGKKTSHPAAAMAAAISVSSTVHPADDSPQVSFSLMDGSRSGYVKLEPNAILIGLAGDSGEPKNVEATVDYPFTAASHKVRVDVRDAGQVEVFVDDNELPAASHTFGDIATIGE